ncbi:hypothetical protein B0181_01495 [Moraxella caviae]|uniref:PIN domain-containing protein n=2 Tax=Moraxella caviae TaxID=34060 RepID=A0A1T0AAT9_9GAMM|nr:hypothetical protein B0181_01495 [Moraxella caviae]
MIILDTNVISELSKPIAHPNVVQWFDHQDENNLYITSISITEIYVGLYRLPDGKRKQTLLSDWDRMLNDLFKDKILEFHSSYAPFCAKFLSEREKMGLPLKDIADAQILGIAHAHQATIATRNTKDFAHGGVVLVNPFGVD